MLPSPYFYYHSQFFSFISFFPIPIIGQFMLGDTGQVHILHTKRGDRYVGNIYKWKKDNISININDNISLQYSINNIELIEANQKAKTLPINKSIKGFFEADINGYGKQNGQLYFYGKNGGRFKKNGKGRIYFKNIEVDKIQFVGSNGKGGKTNNYTLRIAGLGVKEGKLLAIKKHAILFQQNDRPPNRYPIKSINM